MLILTSEIYEQICNQPPGGQKVIITVLHSQFSSKAVTAKPVIRSRSKNNLHRLQSRPIRLHDGEVSWPILQSGRQLLGELGRPARRARCPGASLGPEALSEML